MSLQGLSHITTFDNLMLIIEQGALMTQQEQLIATGFVKSGKVSSLQTFSSRKLPPSQIYRGVLPFMDDDMSIVSSIYLSPLYTDSLILGSSECAIIFPTNLLFERKDWRVGGYNSYGHSISGNPEDGEYDYRSYYQFARQPPSEYRYEICFHSFIPIRDAMVIAVTENRAREVRQALAKYQLQNLARVFVPGKKFRFTVVYKHVTWRGVEPTHVRKIPSSAWYKQHYKTSVISVKELERRQANGEQ